jgi:glycosyltransferase involved in cell wall biosynthesis
MKPRIVFCRSNPIAPDPRVEKEAHALSEAGYPVQVLGWDRTGNLPQADNKSSYLIHRLPIRAGFGRGLMNLPQLLRWQVGLFSWLARRRREYDLIHACDFDTLIPAMLCKLLWHKGVVYDIFDFYADHLRATPGVVKSAIRALDLRLINHVDGLILADEARLRQINGTHPKRIEFIYNTPQEFHAELAGNFKETKGALALAYIGLLQVERGLLELMEILRRHPEWRLELAGFGGDEALILDQASGLPNVTWHGRVDYDQALALSASADVLLATYDPSIPNHRYSSPNKVFEAMMLGIPVIVARGTNMDEIIAKADCGLIVEYGNLVDLENALSRLCRETHLRRTLGENGRTAYENTYSWRMMQNRLIRLYEMVSS